LLIMVLVDGTWRRVERTGKNEKTMSGELDGANIRSFFSADVASISMVACSVLATRDCQPCRLHVQVMIGCNSWRCRSLTYRRKH
jgi:hypothetical protein